MDMEQARAIAKSHEYECGDDAGHDWDCNDDLPLTAFGDGTTACDLETIHEVSESDFQVLSKHGVSEIDLVARVAKV
jgi:hypothetical protein